jgi:integration host factor subunit beta
MTRSELIAVIARKQHAIPYETGESAVKGLLELMSEALASGERIEIRGFGSFSLHFRSPRVGRNLKTGEPVPLIGKYVAHFKPGKDGCIPILWHCYSRQPGGTRRPEARLRRCCFVRAGAAVPSVGRHCG